MLMHTTLSDERHQRKREEKRALLTTDGWLSGQAVALTYTVRQYADTQTFMPCSQNRQSIPDHSLSIRER